MKKKIFGCIFALSFFALALTNINISLDNKHIISLTLNEAEALASEGSSGGDVIKCYCKNRFLQSKACVVNGDQVYACAQGKPGENIQCTTYKSNCG